MKKNITINLFGALYNIDEDAYELLDQYQANMRRYFTRLEGGEEIADDVEHRVAELFAELKAEGVEAITIEHVQDIIHRIGNPEEMGEADDEAADDGSGTTESNAGGTAGGDCPPPPPSGHEPKGEQRARRKFFRDPEDKMLGGVLSGICHYFGCSDPLPWRLIFVLLCIFTYSGLFWAYLILWALMPEAVTPEDRLMMHGRPVNPETLNEELMRGVHTTKNFIQDPATQNKARGCLSGLLSIAIGIFKVGLIGLLLFFGFIGILLLFVFTVATFKGVHSAVGTGGLFDSELTQYLALYPEAQYWLIAACVLGLIAIAMPLFALLRSFLRRRKGEEGGSFATPLGIIGWLVAVAATFGTGAVGAAYIQKAEDQIDEQRETRNGIRLNSWSWDELAAQGWSLSYAKNIEKSATGDDDDPRLAGREVEDDDFDYARLVAKAKNKPMEFRLERYAAVEPGIYRIEALYRLDGERQTGWYVKLPGDSIGIKGACSALTPGCRFPSYSWAEARGRAVLSEGTDSLSWPLVQREAEDDHWCYYTRDVTVTKAGTLEYGFYQDAELNRQGATTREFRVGSVRLTRLDAPAVR